MENLVIEGKNYIPSKRAAELMGYTQDYIGQLCRGGKISAERISGVWYVSEDEFSEMPSKVKKKGGLADGSLNPSMVGKTNKTNTKKKSKKRSDVKKNKDNITLGGVDYISSRRAAELMGYTQDYIGQLCRGGRISAERIGKGWYIPKSVVHKDKKVTPRKQEISHEISQEKSLDNVITFKKPKVIDNSLILKGSQEIKQQEEKQPQNKEAEEQPKERQKIESEAKPEKEGYYYPSFLEATYSLDNTPLVPTPKRSREPVLHKIVTEEDNKHTYGYNRAIRRVTPQTTPIIQREVPVRESSRSTHKITRNILEPEKHELAKRFPTSLMKPVSVGVTVLLFASITTFIPSVSMFSSDTGILKTVFSLKAQENSISRAETVASVSKTPLIETIVTALVGLFEEEIEYKAE